MALEKAAGDDIFFIPQVHFATETQALVDDEGWWYRVRSVIWIRRCRKCGFRKEQKDFTPQEWSKKQPAICVRCDRGKGVTRVSSGKARSGCKRVKKSPNPPARRPRAAHEKGSAVREATSQQLVKYGHKEKAECTLCKKAHEENGSSWKGEEVLNELWQNIWTAAKGNNWTYLKCRMPRTKGSIHSCAQCVHQGVATGNRHAWENG